MGSKIQQVNEDYFYNLINSLIDYKGDVARNSKSDGQPQYSPDFSPNNIRRLIVSGDGARIDFHVSVDGKLSKIKSFSDLERMKLVECTQLPNYKPMLWSLAERVCSSIEEVIICTQNKMGVDLSRELNFEGLISKYNRNNGDVKQAISARYKRLIYFTIVNCDISSLVRDPEVGKCNTPFRLISETPFVSGVSAITKFKDDYYNYYGSASVYELDGQGSRLNEHFKKVKADAEMKTKQLGINKLKADRLKGLSDKFNKEYKYYSGVYTSIKKLSYILNTEGLNYMCKDLPELDTLQYLKPADVKEEFSALSDKDVCERFITSLSKSTARMYSDLVKWYLTSLLSLKSSYKITSDLIFKDLNKTVVVPPDCADVNSQLGNMFLGSNLVNSVSNVCSSVCQFFVTSIGKHNISKYCDVKVWSSNFDGGEN